MDDSKAVTGIQNFHRNGNVEKGGTNGTANPMHASDESIGDDSWQPCDKFKNKEREVDRVQIFTEQDNEGINGSAKGMGLSPEQQVLLFHTPNGKEHNMGLNSENSKAEGENGWQVYSRRRRGQKKSHWGLYDPTSDIDMQGDIPQIQSTQYMAQQGIHHSDGQVHSKETADYDGGIATNSESESQHNQEATYIWSKAKQLGVSGGEDHKIIFEKN